MSFRNHRFETNSVVSIVATIVLASATLLIPSRCWAQEDTGDKTKTIERKSMGAQADRDEAPYAVKENRLQAKPLDWNTTIGKPGKAAITPEEQEAIAKGKPETAPGGAADPKAIEDAKKLHPEDWR